MSIFPRTPSTLRYLLVRKTRSYQDLLMEIAYQQSPNTERDTRFL